MFAWSEGSVSVTTRVCDGKTVWCKRLCSMCSTGESRGFERALCTLTTPNVSWLVSAYKDAFVWQCVPCTPVWVRPSWRRRCATSYCCNFKKILMLWTSRKTHFQKRCPWTTSHRLSMKQRVCRPALNPGCTGPSPPTRNDPPTCFWCVRRKHNTSWEPSWMRQKGSCRRHLYFDFDMLFESCSFLCTREFSLQVWCWRFPSCCVVMVVSSIWWGWTFVWDVLGHCVCLCIIWLAEHVSRSIVTICSVSFMRQLFWHLRSHVSLSNMIRVCQDIHGLGFGVRLVHDRCRNTCALESPPQRGWLRVHLRHLRQTSYKNIWTWLQMGT